MTRIPNDADIEMMELAATGNRLHRATTTGTPIQPDSREWREVVSAARLAYLTGEPMVLAIAERCIEMGAQITDSQLWLACKEAQREPA